MEGTAQWSQLIFISGLLIGAVIFALKVRGWIADHAEKTNASLAALSNAIQDRNFLLEYRLAIADLTKDVRHLKANFVQHQQAAGAMHDDVRDLKNDVKQLLKAVNGKH